MNPLYIDLHVLQSVPPSNMNRDDAGSPKQAVYGGARRARVSSQAWKRAARMAFADTQPEGDRAVRTRQLMKLLTERLESRGGFDEATAQSIARQLLEELGIKAGKKEDQISYLLFFGRPQLDAVVDQVKEALASADDNEDLADALMEVSVERALGTGHPVDVALFGRMVADLPQLNVDAAVQVAHALSTHAIEIEFDYFTAVDDENLREETGAGMIGTVEFNSATLYRYATVGFHQLVANLGNDVEAAGHAIRGFLDSFVTSRPTGHQNAFGNRTRPGLVAVAIRGDQPVNLVSAFEAPIQSSRGVFDRSMTTLAATYSAECARWGDVPVFVGASYQSPSREDDAATLESAFGPSMGFTQLVAAVDQAIAQRVATESDNGQ